MSLIRLRRQKVDYFGKEDDVLSIGPVYFKQEEKPRSERKSRGLRRKKLSFLFAIHDSADEARLALQH
jgi:hypothetical protein